jgi:hypothetical protein
MYINPINKGLFTYYQDSLDMVSGEAILLLKRQQYVYEVLIVVLVLMGCHPGRMVVDELVEEVVPALPDAPGLGARHLPDELDPAQAGEVVLDVEPSEESRVDVGELPEQPVAAFLHGELARDGAADEVVDEGVQELAHVDGLPRGGGAAHPAQRAAHLLLPRGPLRPHLAGVEQVHGDQLPRLAEVVAVGREARVGGAVHDDVGHQGARAGGEDVVVGAEHGLGDARRRDHHGRHGAEAEQHQVRAVPGGERGEGHVGDVPHQVQVPDDGELHGRRRQQAQELVGVAGRRRRRSVVLRRRRRRRRREVAEQERQEQQGEGDREQQRSLRCCCFVQQLV